MSKLLFEKEKKKTGHPVANHEEDKRGKRRENKKRTWNEEHTKSIANTNQWVNQLKRVFFFFRIKMERVREWVFFFSSFFFLPFFYLSLLYAFCNLFFYKLKIWWWEWDLPSCYFSVRNGPFFFFFFLRWESNIWGPSYKWGP